MTANENLFRDYGRLSDYLRGISLRLRLLTAFEFFILSVSGLFLIFLGSLSALEYKETYPYFTFIYSLVSIFFLVLIVLLGVWRFFSKLSTGQVAKGLEEKFPHLKDDVTNSLLLFHQIGQDSDSQISEGLVTAHLSKTAERVTSIDPRQVVSLKRSLRHFRLFFPLLLTFLIVLALDPQLPNRSLALIIDPFSILPKKETSIAIEPGKSIILRGTPVLIKARATGNIPESLNLTIWPEGQKALRLNMEPEGDGRFAYRMAAAQSSFSYQAHSGRAVSPIYSIRVVDPPDLGRLKLTLIPPDYTRLPKEVKEGGNIEALKGTVVNLEALTSKLIKEGKIILNQGNQLILNVDATRLVGSMVVFYPGTYSIHVKDELGFENPNPAQYRINLIPDKYPEGEIISPAQDLEVSGSEVVPIVYTAKDDFEVTSLRLTYQMGGMERSINLKSPGGGRFVGPDTFKWDLSSLALTPGERVIYRLEVWDNDAISGPKVGYSRAFSLSVKDERDRAAKEAEEARYIADALLELLGDRLEEIKDPEKLLQGLKAIEERVAKNIERMGNQVEQFDLEALKRNLASLNKRIFDEPKETVTQEMERLALLAEDIAKRAKMNEVEALAKEIRTRERRLIDLLHDFKGPLTKEGLETILKELKKLEDLLRSVMEALSKMASQLPDEFINSSQLSGLDFNDLFKDLEEIRRRLMAGDLAGALEAAQRLLQALSEMMAALGKAGAQANMGAFDRLQSEMSRQTSELEKIVREQQEILAETEKIDREMRRLREEETGKRLNLSLPQLKDILGQLHRALSPEQKDSAEELRRLFEERQLERFSQLARDLEKELSGKQELQKFIEELMRMADDLTATPSDLMTPERREDLSTLSTRQENLKDRTQDLRERLEMLAQLFPGMDTEILNDFKAAEGSMGKASDRLKKEDAPGAIPPEQDAIRSLAKSQQGMQQMAQQMAMRMQAARWAYPLAYDPRPGWYYGPTVPMPTLPQPEFRRPRERGYTGIDREEFDLPSKDAYQVPKIFREQVTEALKEDVPSQYKRDVERYFKGLTE